MKTELQGEGSYKYECDDPECFYCEKLGLNIKERPVFFMPLLRKQSIIKHAHRWTLKEMERLLEIIDMPLKQITEFFPGRSELSIEQKKHHLREKRKLIYELLTIE